MPPKQLFNHITNLVVWSWISTSIALNNDIVRRQVNVIHLTLPLRNIVNVCICQDERVPTRYLLIRMIALKSSSVMFNLEFKTACILGKT